MLVIIVHGEEQFDESSGEFVNGDFVKLELEHSLVSLSKWESLHEKPFLGQGEKTTEEVLSYVKMMILGEEPPPEIFSRINNDNFAAINTYINEKMTATWFTEPKSTQGSHEVVTAELIYYWMIAFNIPFECQHWHLNKLLTLIKVCNIKNAPKDKMNRSEMVAQRRLLNDQRRAQFGTSG